MNTDKHKHSILPIGFTSFYWGCFKSNWAKIMVLAMVDVGH